MDQRQLNDWDAVDACLECIVSCSIDDGECVETCVRICLGEDEELWPAVFAFEPSLFFKFPPFSGHQCGLADCDCSIGIAVLVGMASESA